MAGSAWLPWIPAVENVLITGRTNVSRCVERLSCWLPRRSSADDRAATVAEAARVVVEFLSDAGTNSHGRKTVAARCERRLAIWRDVTRRSQTAATEESRIRCLNFEDARVGPMRLSSVHEKLELSHRTSSH
jgi:hypothetical protein